MPTQPAHYPVSVVAKQLGVTRPTIYAAIKRGDLTSHQFPESSVVYVVNDKKLQKQRSNRQRKLKVSE